MKKCICLLAVFCLLFSFAGCENTKPVQKTVFAMDTVMDLQIWGEEAEDAAEKIHSLLSDLENDWSAAKETSLLGQLNAGKDVALTQEQSNLLRQVQQLSEDTGGAFHPRMLSVSRAWGFYGGENRVPSEDEIAAALSDSQWDLGAALKGYAGDRAVAVLDKMDVEYAILNLGGNVQTYGQKPDGSAWQIAIQNPFGNDYQCILSVTGTCAVVTSGNYQRYFEENGIRYHHIMDPETGYPAASGLASVTVVCNNGLTADALSTALFVMGLEEGTQFWRESAYSFNAVFITTEGKVYTTGDLNLTGTEYEVLSR